MGRLKFNALVGAALVILPSAGALAADIPEIPAPAPVGGGWYLRGHIGMSNQQVGSLDNVLFAGAPNFRWLDTGGFDAAPIFGIGVGMQVHDHFRVDVTGEYRGKANFSALDAYGFTGVPPESGTNEYSAKKSEWTFLANGYWDFASFSGITPYVGAGIGASLNTISDFRDINVPNGGVAYGATASQWNLAWALHAGIAMQVSPNVTLDLGYSYLDLGKAHSGDIIASDGTNAVFNPMYFNHITSHDLKLAVRWNFDQASSGGYYPPVVKY
jgi:opacity protein-like surface antigen